MKFNSTSSRAVGWGIVALLVVVCVALWVAVFAATPRNTLTFAVMDVGQGGAIFIESPRGVQVVIDGGPSGAVLSQLARLMPYGDRTLDAVIATHPDADHVAGLVDVLRRFEVGAFIDPGIPKTTATYARLEEEIEKEGAPRYLARRGMTLDLGGGAYIEILYPNRDVSSLSSSRANEGGVVARVVYGENEVLLLADVPASVEAAVAELEGPNLKSDILKVAHHGSKTSTSNIILDAAKPQVAVISVGARNRYGHPTAQVLGRLEAHGVQVFRTDEEGTIVFRSDGKTFTRVEN